MAGRRDGAGQDHPDYCLPGPLGEALDVAGAANCGLSCDILVYLLHLVSVQFFVLL